MRCSIGTRCHCCCWRLAAAVLIFLSAQCCCPCALSDPGGAWGWSTITALVPSATLGWGVGSTTALVPSATLGVGSTTTALTSSETLGVGGGGSTITASRLLSQLLPLPLHRPPPPPYTLQWLSEGSISLLVGLAGGGLTTAYYEFVRGTHMPAGTLSFNTEASRGPRRCRSGPCRARWAGLS